MASDPHLWNPEALAHNQNRVAYIRSTSASIAGATSGVLGLTNLSGFAFYLVASLLVGLLVIGKARREPAKYFQGGALEAVSGGLIDMECLTGYILWWTRTLPS